MAHIQPSKGWTFILKTPNPKVLGTWVLGNSNHSKGFGYVYE